MSRARVLVLSFSRIVGDARVLKQIRTLSMHHDVVTCGYGPRPDGVVGHVQVPDTEQNRLDGRLITLRQYRAASTSQRGIDWVRRRLPKGSADVILANDLDAVPLALHLRPRAGVHADLHEYFPRLHEHDEQWMARIAPYQAWLCRRFLPSCADVTTVGERIAQEYAEQFGVPVGVVTNASPYVDLSPTEVGSPLRLVHSGACLRNRHLEVMVEGVLQARADHTLDLYLTPNHPAYLQELRQLASGSDRVSFHEPLSYGDLVSTLNGYDVGLFVLPPVTFSYTFALPNKVFDYVQARLALLVGPSPEMARLVREHRLGTVTAGFTSDDFAAAVEVLDPATVAAAKQASHRAARALSDEEQSAQWLSSVSAILHGAS